MRKMLKDQAGRTTSKKKDADRRRLDSQIRRTERRALRRERNYRKTDQHKGFQAFLRIDWKKWEQTLNEFELRMLEWQKAFIKSLEKNIPQFKLNPESIFQGEPNPRFRRFHGLPPRSGKMEAYSQFDIEMVQQLYSGPAETGPREAQYDHREESEARMRQFYRDVPPNDIYPTKTMRDI